MLGSVRKAEAGAKATGSDGGKCLAVFGFMLSAKVLMRVSIRIWLCLATFSIAESDSSGYLRTRIWLR
jgi:hypothetical protein